MRTNPLKVPQGDNIVQNFPAFWNSDIQMLRRKLEDFGETLPVTLRVCLGAHYSQRLRSSAGNPMLGEYAVFILGDMLSANTPRMGALAFPWLLLYEHSLLLDDLLDEKEHLDSRESILLSNHLLEAALGHFRSSLGHDSVLWDAYERYRRESVIGMLDEWAWEKSILTGTRSVTIRDRIIQQGRKAALAKFCATALVLDQQPNGLTLQQERGLDCLFAGIQLLDDLEDVEKDHCAGRMNHLLEETYLWHFQLSSAKDGLDLRHALGPNQLLVSLIYSGVAQGVWTTAADMFDESFQLLSSPPHAAATKFFQAISNDCREATRDMKTVLETFSGISEALTVSVGISEKAISDTLNSTGMEKTWNTIKTRFQAGPRAQN